MQGKFRRLPVGQTGGHLIDRRQYSPAGGKAQQSAYRQRQQRDGSGLLQQTKAQLAGRGPHAGQNTQPVEPGLHGDLKGVAQQKHQRRHQQRQHPGQEGKQQGRVVGIGDSIEGQKGIVGLDLVVVQPQPVPDETQRVIHSGSVPEGQLHHQGVRPGQPLVGGDGIHLGKLFQRFRLRPVGQGQPCLPATFLPQDTVHLVGPGVVKQAAEQRQKKGSRQRRQGHRPDSGRCMGQIVPGKVFPHGPHPRERSLTIRPSLRVMTRSAWAARASSWVTSRMVWPRFL